MGESQHLIRAVIAIYIDFVFKISEHLSVRETQGKMFLQSSANYSFRQKL